MNINILTINLVVLRHHLPHRTYSPSWDLPPGTSRASNSLHQGLPVLRQTAWSGAAMLMIFIWLPSAMINLINFFVPKHCRTHLLVQSSRPGTVQDSFSSGSSLIIFLLTNLSISPWDRLPLLLPCRLRTQPGAGVPLGLSHWGIPWAQPIFNDDPLPAFHPPWTNPIL
jgi:hypothetical protein